MEVIPVRLIAENGMLETKSNRNKRKEKLQIIYISDKLTKWIYQELE